MQDEAARKLDDLAPEREPGDDDISASDLIEAVGPDKLCVYEPVPKEVEERCKYHVVRADGARMFKAPVLVTAVAWLGGKQYAKFVNPETGEDKYWPSEQFEEVAPPPIEFSVGELAFPLSADGRRLHEEPVTITGFSEHKGIRFALFVNPATGEDKRWPVEQLGDGEQVRWDRLQKREQERWQKVREQLTPEAPSAQDPKNERPTGASSRPSPRPAHDVEIEIDDTLASLHNESFRSYEAQDGDGGALPPGERSGKDRSVRDYYFIESRDRYLSIRTREHVSAQVVNSRVPALENSKGSDDIPAAVWIRTHRPLEQAVWMPGKPMVIENMRSTQAGLLREPGVHVYNEYEPPVVARGDPGKAERWIDLVKKLYPEGAEHILNCFAHRVQRPWEKINHALILGGEGQGIGKDSILKPLRYAIGGWNFAECRPSDLFEKFNASLLKAVVLRVNEASDMGGEEGKRISRMEFREHCKPLFTAPPETLKVEDKHIKSYRILNCVLPIFTTNNEDSLMIEVRDRRYHANFTDVQPEEFGDTEEKRTEFWNSFHQWLDREGYAHVAAFLAQRDLSRFSPSAPPQKTEAFYRMATSHLTDDDAEIMQIVEDLKAWAFTVDAIVSRVIGNGGNGPLVEWLRDKKNGSALNRRLKAAGYAPVKNPDAPSKGGRWPVGGKTRTVYALRKLPSKTQIAAARLLSTLRYDSVTEDEVGARATLS